MVAHLWLILPCYLTYLVSKVVPHSLHCHLLITLGCRLLLNGNPLHNLPALSPDVSGFTRIQIFHELIQATNWNSLLCDDVDLSTEQWTKKFLEIMEECVPQLDLKKRRNLLPSLENRRLFLSLSTFLKIIHNLIYFPPNYCASPLSFSLRCNHPHQYSIPFAHTNCCKHSFLPNSISLWNNLPLEAVNCTTLPTLIFKYYTLPLIS